MECQFFHYNKGTCLLYSQICPEIPRKNISTPITLHARCISRVLPHLDKKARFLEKGDDPSPVRVAKQQPMGQGHFLVCDQDTKFRETYLGHRTNFLLPLHQCCVTRTRVHFTRTRTRVQFFFTLTRTRTQISWLGPESRPSPSSSGHAVLRCLLWHSIHFVVCFHVLEDKQMLNMWTTRFVTRTRNSFLTRDSDLDSDFEVMTRTRTQRWWLRLGFDNLDSDTALHYMKMSCFKLEKHAVHECVYCRVFHSWIKKKLRILCSAY